MFQGEQYILFYVSSPRKNQTNIYMILPNSAFSVMNHDYNLSTVSGNMLLYSVPITFSSLEFPTYPNMPFLFIIKVEIGCFSGNPCWVFQLLRIVFCLPYCSVQDAVVQLTFCIHSILKYISDKCSTSCFKNFKLYLY